MIDPHQQPPESREQRDSGDAVPSSKREPGERPRSVMFLTQLTVLSLLLHVSGSVVSIAALLSTPMLESVRDRLASQGVPAELMDNDSLRKSLVTATLGNVVLGLLITSAFVIVLLGILNRADWARWGGLGLAAAFALWNVWVLIPGGDPSPTGTIYQPMSVTIAALFLVVNLAWLLVGFNPAVTAWFRRRV